MYCCLPVPRYDFISLPKNTVMKKTLIAMLLATTAIFSFYNCNKQQIQSGQEDTPAIKAISATPGAMTLETDTELAEFMAEIGSGTDRFQFNTNELPVKLVTRNQTTIDIPAGALMQDKQTANGKVTIRVREAFNRSSFVGSGFSTQTTTGDILESAGSILLDVRVNNKPADNQLAVPVTINMTASQPGLGDMQLWSGNTDGGSLTWGPPPPLADGTPVSTTIPDGASSGSKGYTFEVPAINWLNPDKLLKGGGGPVGVDIEVVGSPGSIAGYEGSSGTTTVYFIPKGANGAVQLVSPGGAPKFSVSISGGLTGRFFAYAISGGKYYMDFTDETIFNGLYVTLNLKSVSASDITAAINDLNTY
jgi:hypothetical protein